MSTEINYLILFDKKNFQFSGTERFLALIGLLDEIDIDIPTKSIKFDGSEFKFSLNAESDRFAKHDTELFDLVLESKKNEKDVEKLSKLLREIKIIVSNQNNI